MASVLTDEQKLAEAQDALHQLMIGKKQVSVTYKDRTVQYSNYVDDMNRLRAYILELQIKLGLAQPRRPLDIQW
jgi:hypothetical protein